MSSAWTNPTTLLVLVVMALAAAVTNGAVGYGFSTLFTPVAVLFVSNKLLNPAIVLVELGVNCTLLYREREVLPLTWRRALPVIVGLAPGVVLGTLVLTVLSATWVRIILYAALLPFTTLQIMGIRHPVRQERRWAVPLGTGIGFLYSLTTISGPPLAAFWNNQNLGKNEFRCTVAQIRVAESSITVSTYLAVTLLEPSHPLFTMQSLSLVPVIGLPVLLGVPLGILLFRSLSKAKFLRLVAGVDSGMISFGLLAALASESWINSEEQILLLVLALSALGLLAARMIRNVPANAMAAGPTTPERGGGPPGGPPGTEMSRSPGPPSSSGFVVWLEGLPSSGKSTLAAALAREIRREGLRAEVLDGAETRRLLPPSEGHTREGRELRASRIAHLASLLAANGAATFVPMTTPYASGRRAARERSGPRFLEVWLRCPLAVCQRRDSKGLYEKAAKGEIPHMVGLDDPFEEPTQADLVIDTDRDPLERCVDQVIEALRSRGYLMSKDGTETVPLPA